MKDIEVQVLDQHGDPGGLMMFLAKLTQRGHKIDNMAALVKLLNASAFPDPAVVERVAALPHGTIKRFAPITVAIVGASRRFLAQARTHPVGFNYVSASLQYSDYTDKAKFVVPYALTKADEDARKDAYSFANEHLIRYEEPDSLVQLYLDACADAMDIYKTIAEATDNDTAGYAAPQGLRNILIMQGNHEAWCNFINKRSCNRNTNETQYVTLRIWEELLKTKDGKEFFKYAGPDCMFGKCREGRMSCGSPMRCAKEAEAAGVSIPRYLINKGWPLLGGETID